jgi:hypothetical protein
MKYTSFNCKYGKYFYSICPFTGNLLQSEVEDSSIYVIPEKVKNALKICNNPYLCDYSSCSIQSSNFKLLKKINFYHKILMFIGNKRFFLTRFFSDFRNPMFQNTKEAFMYIAKIPEQELFHERLCLQRSFLALKTSKTFKKNGVLFIGASLPTGNMHAWIIEDNYQPDTLDREWIMYEPLLAFYY